MKVQTLESLRLLLAKVTFPGYVWNIAGEAGRMYLQACFMAQDCKTGKLACQHTRKWYISREATDSEVVQTAFKCVLTSVEHEARETFRYRGQAIFGPHFDVDQLHTLCASGQAEELREVAA